MKIYTDINTIKNVELAIPPNASVEQMEALNKVVEYGVQQGVNVIIQVVE